MENIFILSNAAVSFKLKSLLIKSLSTGLNICEHTFHYSENDAFLIKQVRLFYADYSCNYR
jgi:hypothetical protein